MSISDDPGPTVTDSGISLPPDAGGGSLGDRLISDIGADEGTRETTEPGITHETDTDETDTLD